MEPKTIETITRHLKGIIAALEKKEISKGVVDISHDKTCIGFACDNRIKVKVPNWEYGKKFKVECLECGKKQEIYPNIEKEKEIDVKSLGL